MSGLERGFFSKYGRTDSCGTDCGKFFRAEVELCTVLRSQYRVRVRLGSRSRSGRATARFQRLSILQSEAQGSCLVDDVITTGALPFALLDEGDRPMKGTPTLFSTLALTVPVIMTPTSNLSPERDPDLDPRHDPDPGPGPDPDPDTHPDPDPDPAHGPCMKVLLNMMADQEYYDNPAVALDNAMRKTNMQLHAAHVDDSLSGTTAVAVLLKVRIRAGAGAVGLPSLQKVASWSASEAGMNIRSKVSCCGVDAGWMIGVILPVRRQHCPAPLEGADGSLECAIDFCPDTSPEPMLPSSSLLIISDPSLHMSRDRTGRERSWWLRMSATRGRSWRSAPRMASPPLT